MQGHTRKRLVDVRLLNSDVPWVSRILRNRHTVWSHMWYGRYPPPRVEQCRRGLRRHAGPTDTTRRRRNNRARRPAMDPRHPYVRCTDRRRTREQVGRRTRITRGRRRRSIGPLRSRGPNMRSRGPRLVLLQRPIHPMAGGHAGEGIGPLRRSVRPLRVSRTRTAPPRTRRRRTTSSTHPV